MKSRSPSKPPAKLLADLAEAERWERHFSEQGQGNTAWHRTAARLRNELAKYEEKEQADGEFVV